LTYYNVQHLWTSESESVLSDIYKEADRTLSHEFIPPIIALYYCTVSIYSLF